MVPPSRSHAGPRWAEWRLPLVVVAVLFTATWVGVGLMRTEMRRLNADRFERIRSVAERELLATFAPTQQVLMSLSALVQNTGFNPGEDQWSRHVERAFPYLGPGVVGLGYIRRVAREQAPTLQAEMRARGYPNFTVDQAGAHPQLYIVTNVAPLATNASLLGEDIADGTTRREAAEAAMREGDFEISRRIRLVHGEERVGGLLLFWPIFRDGEIPPREEREANLIGWVYASLRPDSLFGHVSEATGHQLALQVFQGTEALPEALLFTSDPQAPQQPHTFARGSPFDHFGQQWTLWVGSTAAFEAASRTFLLPATFYAGCIVSLLAGGLAWALATARRRALDLAQEMTADLALAERESRKLALVASRTASAVVLADPQWRIEWVNDAFTRITGYPLEEVQGRRPGDFLVGPETDPTTQRAMEEADRNGVPFAGEVLNYRKDRTPYWVEIEMRPLFDEFGRRTGNMALQLEIGRRKRVEAELAQRVAEVQRLALVASRTASSVVIMDPAWRIEWANESFTRLFEYTLDEVRGRRPSEVLHGPATSPETMAAIDQADSRNELFKGEILNYTKSRRPIWVRLEVQPLFDDAGRKLGYLGLHLDISELKRQSAELLAAKNAAEQASLAKSQFLAMMSHEIRTPMNGVIGMTSLLLDSSLTPAQREYAETIRHSGDALLTIIDDILDFSKIESGRMELEHEPFSLTECIERAVDVLGPRAAEKGLELLYHATDDTPSHVRGDANRLRQILINLLSNAVKFTERGEVVLHVSQTSREESRVSIHFAISDTGIGIPQDSLSRLFQSFTQVDASMTRRFGGTGLGLAISKRLVELMGGRLWVDSTAGVGSTFNFVVGLELASEPNPGNDGSDTSALAQKTVLIVDRNTTSRRHLAALAELWQLRVFAAESLSEAGPHLGEPVDAVVVNVARSEDATSADLIWNDRPECPIVLLSSIAERDGLIRPGRPLEVVSKPVKPHALSGALRRLLTEQPTVRTAPVVPDLSPASTGTRAERVLLAEDNPVNQRVALLMLTRLGLRADVVSDGNQVLAAAQRVAYDIILMDVHMPGLDGLAATRELRGRTNQPSQPWIIAVTANAMVGDREQCLAAGMNDYVSKPLKLEELAQALARYEARRVG